MTRESFKKLHNTTLFGVRVNQDDENMKAQQHVDKCIKASKDSFPNLIMMRRIQVFTLISMYAGSQAGDVGTPAQLICNIECSSQLSQV